MHLYQIEKYQKIIVQNQEFQSEIENKRKQRLDNSIVQSKENYQAELDQINQQKKDIAQRIHEKKAKHEKAEKAEHKEIHELKKKLEALQIRMAEVHKESRIILLKIKEKQRKGMSRYEDNFGIVNLRQKLDPISHTPIPSFSSKMSSDSSKNHFLDRNNPTRKSVGTLQTIEHSSSFASKTNRKVGVAKHKIIKS